jgi:signal transduction histidine kinase/ActR/RegA family two-component response regulator
LQKSDPSKYQNHIADQVNTVCGNYSSIIAANLNHIVDPIEKRSAELKLEIKNRHELSLSLSTIIIIIIVILIFLAVFFIYNDYQHRKDLQELLIKSKQQTEEATQIKDLFIANMSHEIRTPLNVILGFSELLSDSALDERQRQQLEAIRKSGENLQMLINDMLELAKLDAGMLQPQRVPFSIRQVVKSVQAIFLPQATEKGLQLSVQTENDIPPQLIGDANRLTQILVNLVSNAVKFTQEGSVRIHIASINKKENLLFLRISVIDTGEGIAHDQREAIFERFYQSTIRIGSGTGLGLPIVKRITEALGGYVVLESTLKKGSAFHIHLPFEIVPVQKQVLHGLPPTLLANQRILLVEDNRLIRQLIIQILEVQRLSFDAAISGEEAIELLQKHENDYMLILTDLQLSDTNGYDLTTRLRNTMNIQIPIIGMSASALEGEKEHCLEAGMNGYVSKPFTASELLQTIGNFIRINDSNEAILPTAPPIFGVLIIELKT